MDHAARKVCIVGAPGVGKSSLATRFLTNTCSDQYLSTVGVRVGSRRLVFRDESVMTVVLWDIAGAEKLTDLNTDYIRGSGGVMIAVDGLRRETLTIALSLEQEIRQKLGAIPMLLLLNKVDREADWEITQADLVAVEQSGVSYIKTSARDGTSVESAFAEIANVMQKS